MTDGQAKSKWCPMIRCAVATTEGHYKAPVPNCTGDIRNPEWSRCIGSECVMWDGSDCGLKNSNDYMDRIAHALERMAQLGP